MSAANDPIASGLATLVQASENLSCAPKERNNRKMMNNFAPSRNVSTTKPLIAVSAANDRCHRCGYGGTDIIVKRCACAFHARCFPWILSESSSTSNAVSDKKTSTKSLMACPGCKTSPCALVLQPMRFEELDDARKNAVLNQRTKKKKGTLEGGGKKRRLGSYEPTGEEDLDNSSLTAEDDQGKSSRKLKSQGVTNSSNQLDADCRVGRWSEEETNFCNKLMAHFMAGQFPLAEGLKLNEFLANVLKLKQSRLTKKMKNAALAAKHFSKTTGYIPTVQECIEFSLSEAEFLQKLSTVEEATDLHFHMQLFWRESFFAFCGSMQQHLDAREWLTSVEEMERRASYIKDAVRMAKRVLYMEHALDLDKLNTDSGVFIDSDPTARQNHASSVLENSIHSSDGELDEFVNMLASESSADKEFHIKDVDALTSKSATANRILGKDNLPTLFQENFNAWYYSSPFLAKVLGIIHRFLLPFEYIEAWVPSESSGEHSLGCRLYFAGNAITHSCMPVPSALLSNNTDSTTTTQKQSQGLVPLTLDERFNLLCFGDYSEKFSFQIGSGLPGRVYATGIPIWEQNISDSSKTTFERCGAAKHFGLRTALGIPVTSPTVGRIVVVFYSQYDRPRDVTVVRNIMDEIVKFLPSPRWKLFIDVGKDSHNQSRCDKVDRASVSVRYEPSSMDRNTSIHPTTNNFANLLTEPTLDASISSTHVLMRSSTNDGDNLKLDVDKALPTRAELKEELILILGEHMPLDSSSDYGFCLPGFMSLRLLLLKSSVTMEEEEMISTILNSFLSFRSSRMTDGEIAIMLTRDFLYLKQIQQFEPQNSSVTSVSQQRLSNGNNSLSSAPLSLLHVPLDSSLSSYSILNAVSASSDNNRIPSLYHAFRKTESDQA